VLVYVQALFASAIVRPDPVYSHRQETWGRTRKGGDKSLIKRSQPPVVQTTNHTLLPSARSRRGYRAEAFAVEGLGCEASMHGRAVNDGAIRGEIQIRFLKASSWLASNVFRATGSRQPRTQSAAPS
jgi:hypothetical protein